MKLKLLILLLLTCVANTYSQTSFKCGWDTYKAKMIIHEYTYSFTYKDSIRLYLADSTRIYVASDSQAVLSIDYPFHDKIQYRTANYYNAKKKLVKTEEYKDNNLQNVKEYKYDDKGRKIYQVEDNKVNGNVYKKQYDFSTDKKNGDFIIHEASYFNGRPEFFTNSYYDRNDVLYKEVRLNDNNKDLVHTESFKYGANGKLKERSVYFNEFKVTKTFPETAGEQLVKCFNTVAINITDKMSIASKVSFLKKLIQKNQAMIMDAACHEYEYKFTGPDCEVIVSTVKGSNIKQVVVRYKERVPY